MLERADLLINGSNMGRLFLSGFIGFILSFIGIFGTVGMNLYSGLEGTLDSAQNVIRNRAVDNGLALAGMAGTQLTDTGFVNLSSMMFDIVRHGSSPGYQIEKIMYLDARGTVRAHSDASQIAKENAQSYNKPEYMRALGLTHSDPWNVQTMPGKPEQYAEWKARFISFFKSREARLAETAGLIHFVFPGRANKTYHYGFAVFPIDGESAIGSIHFIVVADPAGEIVEPFYESLIRILAFAFGSVILITALIMALVAFLKPTRSLPVHTDAQLREASVEIIDDLDVGSDVPELEFDEREAPENRSRILDAIPLDGERG